MRSPPTFLTTTENNLPDYRITERFGVVRGITVRSRSVFGTIGAVLQQLRGGDISLLTDLCEQTRAAAFDLSHRRISPVLYPPQPGPHQALGVGCRLVFIGRGVKPMPAAV